jgi:23S rRNA (guanosine2251-2'-O)-methyltransferase
MPRGPEKVATLEGIRPVIEAIRAGRRRVHLVRVPRSPGSTPGLRELLEVAAAAGIPVEATRQDRVSAAADPYPELEFEQLLGAEPAWLLALDRVTDVGNLGSLARSAEIAGVDGLVLESRRSPPINAGALRASAGALEHLQVARAVNLRRALELARAEGYRILVADATGQQISHLPGEGLESRLILVLGSEDRGVREGIRQLADAVVGIPQLGRTGSLGVAAAGAYLVLRLAELRGPGAGTRENP